MEAPADVAWEFLVDPEFWPLWGPSVRAAQIDGDRMAAGARGTVTTVARFAVPFEITNFDDGIRWAWKIVGVEATDHTVEPIGSNRCRVGIGVPWPAAPYLAICKVGLSRLERLATQESAQANL